MTASWKDRRFSFVQVLLACVLVSAAAAVAAAWLARSRAYAEFDAAWHPEARALRDKYGPHRNSYHTEEWIIRDFFQDRKDGFFVDLGANHYQITSNTYYLEKNLNWSGIAVEPLRQFEADYVKHRPRTRFRPFFVSDVSNEKAKMYVLSQTTLISSSDKSFTERAGSDAKEIEVPTITLDDLLQAERVQRIDFMNIDIELSEPKALAGFDIARFRPELVCIEAHPEVRQQILDYFARHGYVVVAKYVRADESNLYFTPLS
jgi:FkbM family methyltransferase